jgi:hypothetical protein
MVRGESCPSSNEPISANAASNLGQLRKFT